MRQLTRKQKKLLDEWYEENKEYIQSGIMFFDLGDCDCFSSILLKKLEKINDTEILYQEINRYISDKGMRNI